MKKIISIILVFLMVFPLGLVCLADTTDVSSVVSFPDDISYIFDELGDEFSFDFRFYSDGNEYSGLNGFRNSTATSLYYHNLDGSKVIVYNSLNGGWMPSYRRHLELSGFYSDSQYGLLNDLVNLALLGGGTYGDVCDGTTCGIADLNNDWVCDTCGEVLSYSVRGSAPVPEEYEFFNGRVYSLQILAPEGAYLDMREYFEDFNYCAVMTYKTNQGVILFVMDKEGFVVNGNNFTFAGNSFVYNDMNKQWEFSSSYTTGLLSVSSMTWATFDVIDIDGTVLLKGDTNFIQDLLFPGVEGLQVIPRTMMILALVGVGCLALLISLHLLATKFRLWLI